MNPNSYTALIAGLFSLAAAIILAIFNSRLQRDRDRRMDQRKTMLEHLRIQIQELYAPLSGLLQQSFIVHEIAKDILPLGKDGQIHPETLQGEDRKKWIFLTEKYFLPLNEKVQKVIISNYHLLEGDLPPRFKQFIEHEMQFHCFHHLWKECHIVIPEPPDRGFPRGIDDEVQSKLAKLKKQHQAFIEEIKRDEFTIKQSE